MAKNYQHDGLEKPSKESWACSECELVGDAGTVGEILMTNTRCECLKKWWAVNHVHGCNDSTCECQVNGLNANDAEKWPPDTQCRGSSRCDGVPTGEAGVPKKGVPLKSSCVIVQQIKYDYRTAGHLLCDYCYWHGAGFWGN